MRAALRLGCLVLVVLFAEGSLGLLSPGLNRLGASTSFLLYVVSWRHESLLTGSRRSLAGSVLLAVVGLGLAGTTGEAKLAGVVFLLLAWEVRLRASGCTEALPSTALVALVLYAAYRLLHLASPALWSLEQAAAHALSALAGRLVGEPYVHGPTTQALPALVFFEIFTIVHCLGSRPRRPMRALVFLAGYVLVNLTYQALLTPVAVAIQRWRPAWQDFLFNSQILFVVLALLPSALLLRDGSAGSARSLFRRSASTGAIAPIRAVLPIVAGLAAGILLAWPPRTLPAPGRVLIYDRGINFQSPRFGQYGDKSGGMFGLLPGFLEGLGLTVTRTERLTAEALDGADCVVSINLNAYPDSSETRALWDFVRGGGSLLAMGDHTGVLGIRGPYNELLRPAGVEFLFDSATFLGRSWENALELRGHPTLRGVRNADEELSIWVGASLATRRPARPVVVARYGYSDLGELANFRGAYLGDRRYNPGEMLGDLVLVAAAGVGRGKVLVFGDTSTFQNLALLGSHGFVARAFAWLTGETRGPPVWPRRLVLAGLLLTGAGWAVLGGASLLSLALAAAGLALGWSETARPRGPDLPPLALRTAVIDASHAPRFDRLSWYDGSIGGLAFNLMRSGYYPLLRERFDPDVYGRGEVLVLIAPAARFHSREITWIREYARRGGQVILTVGYEESEGSRQLLRAFGGEIANVPLTTGFAAVRGDSVRFHEAWPVRASTPSARVLARFLDEPVVVHFPFGEGGLVAIGDTYFLQNRNLEGREVWYEGNIAFLANLLESLRKGPLDAAPPATAR